MVLWTTAATAIADGARMRAIRSDNGNPWTWPTETWRGIVDHVRAGRSLKPSSWKGGATWAVALSFDSDHETVDLRHGGKSFSRISQGQYGAREIGRASCRERG